MSWQQKFAALRSACRSLSPVSTGEGTGEALSPARTASWVRHSSPQASDAPLPLVLPRPESVCTLDACVRVLPWGLVGEQGYGSASGAELRCVQGHCSGTEAVSSDRGFFGWHSQYSGYPCLYLSRFKLKRLRERHC